jgi:plasmid stability protein
MATLYVENVPEERYEALREQARQHRCSIAAEVIALLEENVPTEKEMQKRREFYGFAKRMHEKKRPRGSFPTTEEMVREERER